MRRRVGWNCIELGPNLGIRRAHVYEEDAIALLRALPDHSVTLIATDPPYANKYIPLYEAMAKEAKRVLRIGGSLITLCGHKQLPGAINGMAKHLRFWWPLGMIHTTLQRMPGAWVCIQGKPGLWFVNERRFKGDTQAPVDYMKGGGRDKKHHDWGQPEQWFSHYVERLSASDDLVVDPFVGGGTTLAVCVELGRRSIGCDLDPVALQKTIERLRRL